MPISTKLQSLLDAAQLPESERREFAARLMDTLDDPPEELDDNELTIYDDPPEPQLSRSDSAWAKKILR